jgi:hypothetical protein
MSLYSKTHLKNHRLNFQKLVSLRDSFDEHPRGGVPAASAGLQPGELGELFCELLIRYQW